MVDDQAVKEEIVQLLGNFYAVEKQIKEKESIRTLIRNRLEEIAQEHGDMSIENIGVIKIIPESTTITIDGKEVQRVIDLLLKKDMFEYASMLSKAKKETIRQKSLRITKWKEKA
jgi:siderophore synthetase component